MALNFTYNSFLALFQGKLKLTHQLKLQDLSYKWLQAHQSDSLSSSLRTQKLLLNIQLVKKNTPTTNNVYYNETVCQWLVLTTEDVSPSLTLLAMTN